MEILMKRGNNIEALILHWDHWVGEKNWKPAGGWTNLIFNILVYFQIITLNNKA